MSSGEKESSERFQVRPADTLDKHINDTPQETERPGDVLHEAIKLYIGGTLSLAPLEATSPKRILEMGCGSGAWAIQAAEQFPDADVLAVDMSPLPSRPLPANIRFQTLDLTKPLPFELQSFDIIHARFVFFHFPVFEEVLSRTIELLKPGGWLLLDDHNDVFQDGPGKKAFWQFWHEHLVNENMNPLIGSALQGILKYSGLFSEVNAREIVIPLSRWDDPSIDIGLRRIAETFRRYFFHSLRSLKENNESNGLMLQLAAAAEDDLNDPSCNLRLSVYFTWSRKRE